LISAIVDVPPGTSAKINLGGIAKAVKDAAGKILGGFGDGGGKSQTASPTQIAGIGIQIIIQL
jgi:hypothetical protein